MRPTISPQFYACPHSHVRTEGACIACRMYCVNPWMISLVTTLYTNTQTNSFLTRARNTFIEVNHCDEQFSGPTVNFLSNFILLHEREQVFPCTSTRRQTLHQHGNSPSSKTTGAAHQSHKQRSTKKRFRQTNQCYADDYYTSHQSNRVHNREPSLRNNSNTYSY